MTDIERKMLETYLKSSLKLADFRVLMCRIRKNHKQLKSDLNLIDTVLQKSKKV